MPKICDNTSVGVIVRRGDTTKGGAGEILMIERYDYPESFTLPSGHGDGLALEAAAKKETEEETGIEIMENKLLWKGTINNQCRREGGDHHIWEVFEAINWAGEPNADSDAKNFFWALPARLRQLANRTEYFMEKYNIPYDRVGDLTKAIFGDPKEQKTDVEWRGDNGLEPVWYYILKQVKIL